MTYDQAQSERLGQTKAVNAPAVRIMADGVFPQAPYPGQLIHWTTGVTPHLAVYTGSTTGDIGGAGEGWILLV